MMRYVLALTMISMSALPIMAAQPDKKYLLMETPESFLKRYHFEDYLGAYELMFESALVTGTTELPLRVLHYGSKKGSGSSGIVLASIGMDGALTELYKSKISPDGVTPTFEGIDILGALGGEGCVLTLRWLIQGNGHMQIIQTFRYANGTLTKLEESSVHGGAILEWEHKSELP
jgi:hypothetical protein